jgi:lysophospholipase L1-like esterase
MHLRRLACCLLLAASAQAQHWVGTWASSQQPPDPSGFAAPADLDNAVLRQIVHLSIGGPQLRIHLSNAFGTQPLHIASAHIARAISPATSAIDPATDHAITFNGSPDVLIPAGAEYLSDPIPLAVPALANLAITLQLADPLPSTQTGHSGSRATSYIAHNVPLNTPELSSPKTFEHWIFLSAIDVAAPARASALVALGDSITDGHATTTNGNDRWTDVLSARLHAAHISTLGVLNQGIGGNRLLNDGLGPNVLARLDRDVLAQTAVHSVILLEGVNDLGTANRLSELSPEAHAALVQRILSAYSQIIERAHAHGISVIGATITPYTGSDYYHPSAASEADRQTINAWIRNHSRAPHHFDAVIDFDKAVADPIHPDHLLPAFDSGDHLHPSPKGYAAMANAIPLNLLTGASK